MYFYWIKSFQTQRNRSVDSMEEHQFSCLLFQFVPSYRHHLNATLMTMQTIRIVHVRLVFLGLLNVIKCYTKVFGNVYTSLWFNFCSAFKLPVTFSHLDRQLSDRQPCRIYRKWLSFSFHVPFNFVLSLSSSIHIEWFNKLAVRFHSA